MNMPSMMAPSLHAPALPASWPSALPEPEALGFGAHLGPWIVEVAHEAGRGWGVPRIVAREDGRIDLATGGLQYGLSVFEGLKAFRGPDGSACLFRPREHARRLSRSAERLAMPTVPECLFMDLAWCALQLHRDWLPPHGRGSLYLRPTLFACEEGLGLREASRHVLAIIATPCSQPARKPKRLWAERELVRAAPGGIGAAKTGGNYAASLLGMRQARACGYDDVLWLDAAERRWMGEAGTANLFVALDERILTPPLDGSILPGITRDCVIELLKARGHRVEETSIALEWLLVWSAQGRLREIFCTGTAVRITPVEEIAWNRGAVRAPAGPLTEELDRSLSGIQEATVPDTRGWLERLPGS